MKYDLKNMTREMALSMLELPDKELPVLLEEVYEIRKKYKGNTVGIHLLTNARSGDCSQNCTYCAQSRDSKADIDKYRLITYEKLQQDGYTVKEKNLARHCIGLSGIRFSDEEIREFADEVRMLKKETNSPICCSIGFLTEQQAVMLREAGVDRINHNLNTSRKHYPNICTSHTYEERLDNIKRLKSLGFELCCGGIIGLGETNTDVVDMLFQIQSIQPKAVPINFLIPLEGTGLEHKDTSYLTGDYCLKVLCLARLLCPQSDIRCAAGREVYLKGREKQMFCAADSIFASGYLTADGQGIDDTIKMITDAGFQYYVEP
ncbi:MAG: biotin synthase BioB [Clostridiales bacterium]|uniref:biotin synthase BioB n=1 Tax=Clostridium sp. 12(A) TaxID=1163671 RepID=UPI000463DA30|nr:biotin synthase BioB [Clostridium sp. 12(A)]MBS5957049.1 biotin synthase BioB [Clostridiales bacterium]